MITFENVEKRYPDGTIAVESLSLELETAKTTVFVGPSGCGKTTSLRMINRMIEPTGGEIRIDGRAITEMPKAQLRRGIGYVIQNAGLFPHRTVLQNICTVPRLNGTPAVRARARAFELMETVGLPADFANRYPAQLSGGQQQRVGVARALAAEPTVLLMDEPFSALDPVVRHELQEEFARLGDDLGTTIVFVTHDIDEAIRLGDRIAVFEKGGRLSQVATPQELLTRPANDFVARFVGRDRGYRSLSFLTVDALACLPARTIRVGDSTSDLDASGAIVVRADGRYVGAVRRDEPNDEGRRFTRGAFVRDGDSVRTAMDAVLSSESGTAVYLDGDDRVLGLVTVDSLAAQLRTRPAPRS